MIRKFNIQDLDQVMKIWLETNIQAHDFIVPEYWKENYSKVKEILPQAHVLVYEEENTILGFIGVCESEIAGIFVDFSSQRKGIGHLLLEAIKRENKNLSLCVYEKNQKALSFYIKEGFNKANCQRDPHTNEVEWVMTWKDT